MQNTIYCCYSKIDIQTALDMFPRIWPLLKGNYNFFALFNFAFNLSYICSLNNFHCLFLLYIVVGRDFKWCMVLSNKSQGNSQELLFKNWTSTSTIWTLLSEKGAQRKKIARTGLRRY